MRSDDPEAQATAHQLVHCVLDADQTGLTETLETVAAHQADELRAYVREIVAELINVATSAVRDSAGPLRDRAAFAIDLRDDDNDQVGIDDLDPPVRATIRAMLADLNNCQEDASFQLDLAVREVGTSTGIETGLDTVRRALTMTIGLLHWSEQSEPLEGIVDPEPTADEVDLLEQQLAVTAEDEDDAVTAQADDTLEADPEDVREQQRAVPDNDDER
ncbi:MAG: hypothetical protein WBA97_20000 [Actinophytocola sp.]|uniref:hypothetical protein n=1 Tax=Actinophytocola sp. TaxID=1872138 RepID=UPI003C74F920